MKIKITKRIDLAEIIGQGDWDGCFVSLSSISAEDLKTFSKLEHKLEKEIKEVTRELSARETQLESNPEGQGLSERIEELEQKLHELGLKRLDATASFLSDRFVAGLGFDSDTNQKVEMVQDDVKQFPIDVMNVIVKKLTGAAEKKS